MNATRRQILRLAAGLPVLSLGGLGHTCVPPEVDDDDDDSPSIEGFRAYCDFFAKGEVEWNREFRRCTWPKLRYVEAWKWNPDDGVSAVLGYGQPTACRNDRWYALDAIRAAGIEVIHYEPSRCGWAWVGFVRAEKEDVEPLIKRMIRIKPRYSE